jgi:hypothetical protein
LVLAAIWIFGVPRIELTLNTVSTDETYVNGHVTFVAPWLKTRTETHQERREAHGRCTPAPRTAFDRIIHLPLPSCPNSAPSSSSGDQARLRQRLASGLLGPVRRGFPINPSRIVPTPCWQRSVTRRLKTTAAGFGKRDFLNAAL